METDISNKEFRNEKNPKEGFDPIEYCNYYLSLYPDAEIYVGCDSQNKGRYTVYATTICFRVGRRGVHVIYQKEKVERMNDIHQRLWGECERSVAVARMLSDNNIRVDQVELDFNDKNGSKSHSLVKSGKGYIIGFGYHAAVKPEEEDRDKVELVAAKAADHIAVNG